MRGATYDRLTALRSDSCLRGIQINEVLTTEGFPCVDERH